MTRRFACMIEPRSRFKTLETQAGIRCASRHRKARRTTFLHWLDLLWRLQRASPADMGTNFSFTSHRVVNTTIFLPTAVPSSATPLRSFSNTWSQPELRHLRFSIRKTSCFRLTNCGQPIGPRAVRPNPSVKRSAIGRPPSPRSAVVYPALHGLGVLPLSPAYLER